ncbi:hypothetical protein BD769DRAFT_1382164 [Suillus cothurnatus]|nr:hypothetical protein BD769DRAFT_1382164 [Suillus cothurnatus]
MSIVPDPHFVAMPQLTVPGMQYIVLRICRRWVRGDRELEPKFHRAPLWEPPLRCLGSRARASDVQYGGIEASSKNRLASSRPLPFLEMEVEKRPCQRAKMTDLRLIEQSLLVLFMAGIFDEQRTSAKYETITLALVVLVSQIVREATYQKKPSRDLDWGSKRKFSEKCQCGSELDSTEFENLNSRLPVPVAKSWCAKTVACWKVMNNEDWASIERDRSPFLLQRGQYTEPIDDSEVIDS